MFRLLHTADWHLGHTLAGHDRVAEHRAFLSWLVDTLEDKQIDALLMAGDLFESASPPTSAVRMYYDFLAEAGRRCPGLEVVVIGGNHDSAARIDAPKEIFANLGVHVVGGVPADGLDSLVIPLHDREGRVSAQVAALPFLRSSDLPVLEDPQEDPYVGGVRALYGEVVQRARESLQGAEHKGALIAMGHCYMVSGQESASERNIIVGNQEALPEDIFPGDLGYVALGHLHKAQRAGWREWVRYSGSPIPLSMTERDYRHQVVYAEFAGDKLQDCTPIYVPRTTELMRLRSESLPELLRALGELEDRVGGAEDEHAPFLSITLATNDPIPDLRNQVDAVLQGKRARLTGIEIERERSADRGNAVAQGRKLAELHPRDVFQERYRREFGVDRVPEEYTRAFDALLAEAEEEQGEKGASVAALLARAGQQPDFFEEPKRDSP